MPVATRGRCRYLIRLDDKQIRSEEAILEAELAELTARRNRLEAELRDSGTIRWDAELLALAGNEDASCEGADVPNESCKIHAMMDGQQRLLEARQTSRAGLIAQPNRKPLRFPQGQTRSRRLSARCAARAISVFH